jgi:hypothetical protein
VAHSTLSRWALGYAFVHPGYFVSALVSSAIIKVGAEKMQEQTVMQQLEIMTTHFAIVTSNLMNEYVYCSDVVVNSFKQKDTSKVQEAVQKLLTG